MSLSRILPFKRNLIFAPKYSNLRPAPSHTYPISSLLDDYILEGSAAEQEIEARYYRRPTEFVGTSCSHLFSRQREPCLF